jgi:hypothetical protein
MLRICHGVLRFCLLFLNWLLPTVVCPQLRLFEYERPNLWQLDEATSEKGAVVCVLPYADVCCRMLPYADVC